MKIRTSLFLAISVLFIFFSCSIDKLAIKMVSDALGGSGDSTVFTGDNDPQLVGDALPFALKLYETLLSKSPDHTGLLLTTGSGFIMYANAFIQTPADMLSIGEFEKQREMWSRSKSLYLRGRDYVLRAIELRHPGVRELLDKNKIQEAMKPMTAEDVACLYWAAAGWIAAISIDIFDIKLTLEISKAKALMDRAYELNPDYGNGAIHSFYISFYASMPPDMGGSVEKARYHFKEAVRLSNGLDASPYVALAATVAKSSENVTEFQELLHKALSIDPDKNPETRLVNIINQRKARWYLEHINDIFLLEVEDYSKTGEVDQ
ncbi:MAG: TRAP transporter TatT component family protein [Spirochaetota bacterium]